MHVDLGTGLSHWLRADVVPPSRMRKRGPLVFWLSLISLTLISGRRGCLNYCWFGRPVGSVTGQDLFDFAKAWTEITALSPAWFSGLAVLLSMVESVEGLAQGSAGCLYRSDPPRLVVTQLSVVNSLWASSLRLSHLKDWVKGWVPESGFSVGNGVSSVEAWFSTELDIEEVLCGAREDRLHDTLDGSCAFGRLGLPCWFRISNRLG